MDIGVVKNLEGQRVLISEKNKGKKGELNERLYIVPKQNERLFIHDRRRTKLHSNNSKISCSIISATLGVLTGYLIKSSTPVKIAGGVSSIALTSWAFANLNNYYNKFMDKCDKKLWKAEEVTGQDINTII